MRDGSCVYDIISQCTATSGDIDHQPLRPDAGETEFYYLVQYAPHCTLAVSRHVTFGMSGADLQHALGVGSGAPATVLQQHAMSSLPGAA